MEIETSLVNVNEALAQGQTLSRGMQVSLPLGLEAKIYGFIAVEETLFSPTVNMPPLGEVKIISNRAVAYYNGCLCRYPIFRSVHKCDDEWHPLFHLYIPRFFNQGREAVTRAYKRCFADGVVESIIESLRGVGIEEGCAYYYPQENDLYFESSSDLSGFANGLAVITRRLSKETDELRYEIFNSDEVLVEKV